MEIALVIATLLVSLVAGLLLSFAIVVMPGVGTMGDRDFLEAFRAMDRVIQDNQPVFVIVWGGSVVATVAAAIFAIGDAETSARTLISSGLALYLVGTQLPTFVVNVPLNNDVQSHDLDAMSDEELAQARMAFESRWTRWNAIRTGAAVAASLALIAALLMS